MIYKAFKKPMRRSCDRVHLVSVSERQLVTYTEFQRGRGCEALRNCSSPSPRSYCLMGLMHCEIVLWHDFRYHEDTLAYRWRCSAC